MSYLRLVMGTWTKNFLVKESDPRKIREIATRWLERDGFNLLDCPIPPDGETRGLFLLSNPNWTVIIYEKAIEESEGLRAELRDFPVVIQVSLADSDVWGYELVENGTLTAAFLSNPRFFGADEQKLARNGDAERLCRALGLAGIVAEIQRCHNNDGIVADLDFIRFCCRIGVPAASFRFGDLQEWNGLNQSPCDVEGWDVEPLFFKRASFPAEAPDPALLHTMTIITDPVRGTILSPPVFPEMNGWAMIFKVLSWLVRPFFWLLFACLWLGDLLRKRRNHGFGLSPGDDALFAAFSDPRPSPVARANGFLTHGFLGIRVRDPGEAGDPGFNQVTTRKDLGHVFCFFCRELKVIANVSPLSGIQRPFHLPPGSELLADRNFFAGKHPGRFLHFKDTSETNAGHGLQWFVAMEDMLVKFECHSNNPPEHRSLAAVRKIVESLERVPSVGGNLSSR